MPWYILLSPAELNEGEEYVHHKCEQKKAVCVNVKRATVCDHDLVSEMNKTTKIENKNYRQYEVHELVPHETISSTSPHDRPKKIQGSIKLRIMSVQ